ncbi:chemotaxis protein CheW [Sphingomonas sp.]|uniref:chemotaxis protein CheW n=1 Tax=Sphingomonas sp. TaxID=28214 RepID=UPI00286C4EEE|nr:chemotaxis protein CheW [Sphingomonas sp.]
MDDLIADFTAECREMLEALGGEIVAWEAQPDDRARLDSIFRFVHTVKGNCGFFEFPRLEALSHAAEDALADVRSGSRMADSALVSAVLAVLDRIGEMVTTIEAGEPLLDGDDSGLIAALQPGAEAMSLPASPGDGGGKPATQRTIRLSVELLDRVMSGVSDMVLARNELARRLREAETDIDVGGAFERLSGIIADMREAITRTRMQRVENLFVAVPRMVRDLSADLGKQVLVDIDGSDVELDREMIEMIRDPLTHIIRNAVDHGIEPPADRLRAGKREIGLLTLSARQSGNQILIDVADDGRGIDGAVLVEKAIAAGYLTRARADAMTAAERLALIFEAGLSTAQEVTAISGRGVGMDVVRSNIERIGGTVEIDSRPGEGTRMTLRVPLTLTIIPALTVSIGSQHFAIPRNAIDEIVRAGGASVTVETICGADIAVIRGRRMPQLTLSRLISCDSALSDTARTLVVLRPAGGEAYALAVDRVHDHEELVVKPAAPAVMAAGIYAGTTLADDGSPILLLDPAGLAEQGGIRREIHKRSRTSVASVAPFESRRVPILLFRDLEQRRRAIPLGVIDRIEEVAATAIARSAGQLCVQIGDSILPLTGIPAGHALEGKVRMLRLNDGSATLAHAITDVIDLSTLADDIIPSREPGEVSGVALIGGEPAELIDAHWLFARNGVAAGGGTMVCRLASTDPWLQNMLRPIVEAAGYLVIDEHDELSADLTIAFDGEDSSKPPGRTIWLRTDVDQVGARDDSIYRYDREGLMRALKATGAGR